MYSKCFRATEKEKLLPNLINLNLKFCVIFRESGPLKVAYAIAVNIFLFKEEVTGVLVFFDHLEKADLCPKSLPIFVKVSKTA